MEDAEELPELPDKCPICDKITKNLLLHIRKKASCNSKIDPKLYDHWKKEQNKFSKRKFQAAYVKTGKHKDAQAKYVKSGKHSEAQERYVDTGKHKEAQSKYEDRFRFKCKVCKYEYTRRYPTMKVSYFMRRQECNCPPADRASYLQTRRHNQQIRRNKGRIQSGLDDGNKRLEKFLKMCRWCLYCFKNEEILNYTVDNVFNRFHLVEAEVKFKYYDDDGELQESSDDDDTHSWLSDVDGSLLCLVITFQKVVLTPKSKWILAIEDVNTKEDKKHLKEKLYQLIGKLQFYENRNTRDILIPEEFKIKKERLKVKNPFWHWRLPETLTNEDEELLVNLLMDVVADEDVGEELLELLRIDKFADTLERALLYTRGSLKATEKLEQNDS